jgi:hypothetical protein
MTTYARLDPATLQFERLVELTPEQYAALEVNGKALYLRAWSIDAPPVPGPTQVVVAGPVVIDSTTARQTWVLQEKSAALIEYEQTETDKPQVRAMLAAMQAYAANQDVSGTAVQRIERLELWVLRLVRIAIWLVRRFA